LQKGSGVRVSYYDVIEKEDGMAFLLKMQVPNP